MSNWKSDDLVGRTFGRLVVLSLHHLDKNPWGRGSRRYWMCGCQCGEICVILGRSLTGKNTKSCGCYKRERASEANSKRPYERLYNHLVHIATRANWDIDISYEDFVNFTFITRCHYCWGSISWAGMAYNLDRKDTFAGYLKSNVLVCCNRCNRGKSNLFTYAEWWEMTECFRRRNGNSPEQNVGRLGDGTPREEADGEGSPVDAAI